MDEPPITTAPDAETTHKTGHKGARSARIEVITRGERRRVWTPEHKREIVLESLGPDLTPTEVARKHGISSGQLYTWRQKVLGRQMTLLSRAAADFAQVEMTSAPAPPDAPDEKPRPPLLAPRPAGLIEIVLTSGVTLRVDATVDGAALGCVLTALDQR